jgi:ribA/ribD-fused uncharacterized protein
MELNQMELNQMELNQMEKYVFFYTNEFSNFHPVKYKKDEITFSSSEQGFMYDKAMFFGDMEIANQIKQKNIKPLKAKQLGRKVRGFNNETWETVREKFMYDNCYGKFSQNKHLKKKLLETQGKQLVEASSKDKIWGIGHNMKFAPHSNPKYWGLNLLGKTLDKVREDLLEDSHKN